MDDITTHMLRVHRMQTALTLAESSDRALQWIIEDSIDDDDPELRSMAENELEMRRFTIRVTGE